MAKRIAFFDFDGTITTKDTLLEFIKFSKGTARFYMGFILTSPWLVAYKLKFISNQAAKEKVLAFFFRKMPRSVFQDWCDRFAAEAVPALIRPKALPEIRQLQEKGFDVVIVSASPENWVQKWAATVGAHTLATCLVCEADCMNGKIAGANCYGEEKVRRIQENYALQDYEEVYAYGDTSGDKPMLKLAGISFYKPFR